MTFEDLYKKIARATLSGELEDVKNKIDRGEKHNLDCLINAGKQKNVIKVNDTPCSCEDHACISNCLFDAISVVDGNVVIDEKKCVGCNACVENCKEKKLTGVKELIEVINALKQKERPVYALVAPAIVGQFGADISLGKIRNALKFLGFAGVVEVATFADILTLKEAIEFSHNMEEENNFQLTSCCCPVWIALIKKNFDKLSTHLTPAVSPMILAGRCVKQLEKNTITVFISPCLAKRAEARESDVAGAIDFVINFSELKDLFEFVDIRLENYEDEEKEHSSYAGRIYAKTGGVSDAVKRTYHRLNKGNLKPLVAKQANGVIGCKNLLNDICDGKIEANFYEGMGCVGGCVAGPKTLIDHHTTEQTVTAYAESSKYGVPIDNPYVVKILSELGYNTINDLLNDKHLLNRKL